MRVRLTAFLIALLALIGAPPRAMARAACSEKTASGVFPAHSNLHAWPEPPQVLDRVPETTPRDYEPASGRPKWPSRDPIGERGGKNLYGMVRNNPIRYVDTDGRVLFDVGGGPQSSHSTSDPTTDFLDRNHPNRDRSSDDGRRSTSQNNACIGGVAAACDNHYPGTDQDPRGRSTLGPNSHCYKTKQEAEIKKAAMKCCSASGEVAPTLWAQRSKGGTPKPKTDPFGDPSESPATSGNPPAAPGAFDSRLINGGQTSGLLPDGDRNPVDGLIPLRPVDESIDDWRKNTQGYDTEQWCLSCPSGSTAQSK